MSAQVSWQRRLFPSRPLSVMVFLFWLLLSDSFGPQQWVLGLLLGWVVPIFAAPAASSRSRSRSWCSGRISGVFSAMTRFSVEI